MTQQPPTLRQQIEAVDRATQQALAAVEAARRHSPELGMRAEMRWRQLEAAVETLRHLEFMKETAR